MTEAVPLRKFDRTLAEHQLDLKRSSPQTLQLNITKLCNQACVHCHVDSSPRRKEQMSDEILDHCIRVLRETPTITHVDITGGAPELHPKFRYLVEEARALGKTVLVRHNLTVTLDPHPQTKESLSYLPEYFRAQKVEVVSSLPYYQEFFTDKQRGDGVFQKSIESLKRLNAVGYGKVGSGLILNLVYNPAGSFLPAPQADLERDYKRELKAKFDIDFNNLFAITNMPIHRFRFQLKKSGGYDAYMQKLLNAFNPAAANSIMCRTIISVSYDGYLYDCDFNQMLGIHIGSGSDRMSIADFNVETLLKHQIKTAEHCYGCTAGSGSSCGGNTTN
jgi:radical SAM/Cys-rich protein